jgi:hypothetical protein
MPEWGNTKKGDSSMILKNRLEFQSFTNQVGFTWLNDLSLEQVLQRCAALLPHSFILHVLYVMDAAGIPCEKNEPLRRLHVVANASVFGYFATSSIPFISAFASCSTTPPEPESYTVDSGDGITI